MHEAEVMMKLDHPNIVRIIGTVLFLLRIDVDRGTDKMYEYPTLLS